MTWYYMYVDLLKFRYEVNMFWWDHSREGIGRQWSSCRVTACVVSAKRTLQDCRLALDRCHNLIATERCIVSKSLGRLGRPRSTSISSRSSSAAKCFSFNFISDGLIRSASVFGIFLPFLMHGLLFLLWNTWRHARMHQLNYVVDDAFVSLAVWLAGCFLRACSLHDVINRTTTIYSANGSEAMLHSVTISSTIRSRTVCTTATSLQVSRKRVFFDDVIKRQVSSNCYVVTGSFINDFYVKVLFLVLLF